MRLAAGVILALVLTASTAHAEPLPFEIVRMLPETSQVLVYDRAHNTHVLLQPGSTFGDYVVIDIDGLDMVVEKGQERFTVYPREAMFLSLTLYPRAPTLPPVIFGKSPPAPLAPQVADVTTNEPKTTDTKKPIDAKTRAAQELAMVLTMSPRTSAALSSKLKN